jgi:hypothetical protein
MVSAAYNTSSQPLMPCNFYRKRQLIEFIT